MEAAISWGDALFTALVAAQFIRPATVGAAVILIGYGILYIRRKSMRR